MKSAFIHQVAVVVFISLGAASSGNPMKAFLQSSPVKAKDVEVSLAAELGGAASAVRLEQYEKELMSTYKALPKNANGYIDHQVVPYVLHRFFVQRYGWYINGLEPKGDTFHVTNASSTNTTLQGWVPTFLQDKIEERTRSKNGRGFNLLELAAFATTLEDLVRLEATRRLEEVYEVLRLDPAEAVSRKDANDAVTTYLMIYLVGRNVSLANPGHAARLRKLYQTKYTGWNEVDAWLQHVEEHFINTSTTGDVEFPVVSKVVHEMGEQFGNFNNRECQELKSTLMGMQVKPGRISIVDFYNMSLYSHWKFTEKPDYLRDLGALDDSDSTHPMVLLPNYLSSAPNCLRATDLYAVCCPNECEPLLGHLEKNIGKPTAPVEQISSLVSALASPTIAAREQLPENLLRRLQEIAVQHGGEVNLHGRLFAQWMHHAYPNECPFPHQAGTTNPVTADEWMNEKGEDSTASEDERQKYIEEVCGAGNDASKPCPGKQEYAETELPWSDAEELLVAHPQQVSELDHGHSFHPLRGVLFLGVAGMVMLVLTKAKVVSLEKERLHTVLGLCVLAALAITLDQLDHRVFALSLVGGLAFMVVRKLSSRHTCLSLVTKEGKSMV